MDQQSIFNVNTIVDSGDFQLGPEATLAWDILDRTGSHDIPSVIDLSGCVHIKPYAVACLCSLATLRTKQGLKIEGIPPIDTSCAEHLSRLGIAKFLPGNWPEVVGRETNFIIRQCTEPSWETGHEIVDFLCTNLEIAKPTQDDMTNNLDEVIMNALTHSCSSVGCFVVGQVFPRKGKVEIVVLDLGQTIKGHLTQNPKHAHITDDVIAIQKAIEEGETGTQPGKLNFFGEPNGGVGLHELWTYFQAGAGELTILSGQNWITSNNHEEPHIYALSGARFQGTLVNLQFIIDFELPICDDNPII